ncbi:sensor histidine kinase [Paenibacillus sp. HB172176]|uniref:sensor histidine kinase n=1 Tax=Paenibacillus sp. HB172176 TaxID=2493690 RepID=UPI001439B318|nr:sensor histidine kinase [Paenibacillus sp. HB172176]
MIKQWLQRIRRWILLTYCYIAKSVYRKILLSFFLIITITVTTLGLNYYIHTSSDIKHRAIGSMETLMAQSAFTLETYMTNTRQAAWDYFADTDFQSFVMNMGTEPELYNRYWDDFNQFMKRHPYVDFVSVRSLDGDGLTRGDVEKSESFNFSQMKAIAISNNGKGAWVSTTSYDDKKERIENTLVFVQALKKINYISNSPIIGILVFQLSSDYLQEWLGTIGNNEQGEYQLVDPTSNQIMLSHDNTLIGSRLNPMKQLYSFDRYNHVRHLYGKEQEVDTLFVSHQLDQTSWVLVGKIPLKVLLQQVNALTRRTILIGLICLLGAMMLSSLLSSRITTPLSQLRKGIRSIEKGDYRISIPVRSMDEIGYFVRRFNQMASEINSLIVKVYETDLVKKDAEIRALQSQINPHFLYNTLGIIDSLATLHEDERISLVSSSLAKMFRYSVSAGHMSPLHAEFNQIETYLAIQQIRFMDRLSYSVHVDKEMRNVLVPKLLFQPLVENSILHGIDQSVDGAEIRLCAGSLTHTDAYISVWNNGPPIEPEQLEKIRRMLEQSTVQSYVNQSSNSIGLSNVQYRVKLVFGSDYGLTVHSSIENGTEFRIRIRKIRKGEHNEGDDRG